jgi:hypothetical protein
MWPYVLIGIFCVAAFALAGWTGLLFRRRRRGHG